MQVKKIIAYGKDHTKAGWEKGWGLARGVAVSLMLQVIISRKRMIEMLIWGGVLTKGDGRYTGPLRALYIASMLCLSIPDEAGTIILSKWIHVDCIPLPERVTACSCS